jgi:glutathione synthase/RimK-type ligase-like ATP-grasp enzyme
MTAQVITSEAILADSTTLDAVCSPTSHEPTVILSRSREIKLRRFLENRGLSMLSPSTILQVAHDKVETERFARRIGVSSLPTFADLDPYTPPIEFPLVLKDRFGHGGSSVTVITSHREYAMTIAASPEVEWICQPYLSTATVEARTYILGRRRLWTVRKISVDGVRANLSRGALTELSHLDAAAVEVVEACVSALPSGFYGIDIVWDEQGTPLLAEIEDPVGTRALYRHKIDVAATVIDYVSHHYSCSY